MYTFFYLSSSDYAFEFVSIEAMLIDHLAVPQWQVDARSINLVVYTHSSQKVSSLTNMLPDQSLMTNRLCYVYQCKICLPRIPSIMNTYTKGNRVPDAASTQELPDDINREAVK